LYTLIRKRILNPLGLKHTVNGNEHRTDNDFAHGYVLRNGYVIDTYPWFSHYGLADSGIHSTPGDMALFIESLFAGEKVLSQRMRSEMTRGIPTAKPALAYGMGLYVKFNRRDAGLRWYLHDGIDPGYQADFMYLPDFGITIVLAANASMGQVDQVYDKLVSDIVRFVLRSGHA
jgi:CubicO group peptidase (beta-lactamase class C family)